VIDAVVLDVGERWLMRRGSMGSGLTGWAYLGIPSRRYSARSLPWGWITGMHSSIFAPASVSMLSVRGVPTRASQNDSARMIFIRTCGRAWERCVIWVCG